MPGTIYVSVLDFKGISISSSMQITASMGKTECQICEKGDFSFPLMTLRDNLIITLQDAEGNQISRAGVRTMSIVEKGVWDDLFPLEGGGHIRMKLQFVLSDEERNRIRMMREAALKKKQMEMLNKTRGDAEAAEPSSNSTSSPSTNEVSDSRTSSVIPNALTNAGDVAVRADHSAKPDISSENGESHNANKVGTFQSPATPVENELPRPNIQMGPILSEDASSSLGSSEAVDTEKKPFYSRLGNNQDEKLDAKEKTEGREITQKFKESPKEIKFPKLIDAQKDKSDFLPKVSGEIERFGLRPKVPSNIRKMISAFETSLAQEQGPASKSVEGKSQSNRIGMVRLLKDQMFKGATEISDSSSVRHENPAVSSLGRLKNSFSAGDLQRIPANIVKKVEPTNFLKDLGGLKSSQALKQFKESNFQPKGAETSSLNDELGRAQRDIISKKVEKSLEGTKKLLPATEEATFSGREDEEKSSIPELKSAARETTEKEMVKYKLPLPSPLEEATVSGRMHEERDSAGITNVKNEFGLNPNVSIKELDRSNSIRNNDDRSVDEDIKKDELVASGSVRPSSLQSAKAPGKVHELGESDSVRNSFQKEINKKRFSSSKKSNEINIQGPLHDDQTEKNSTEPENIGKDSVQHGTDAVAKNAEEESISSRKSEQERSGDDASTGHFGQIIKIAVVIGFGLLVLLTRQRQPRKAKSKEDDPPFGIGIFIDQHITIEEQLKKIDIF